MPRIKRLVIFENPAQAKAISRRRKEYEDATIVSFSIPGKFALAKMGMSSYFPNELVEFPDLNKIGKDNITCVKNVCNFLDNKLKEKINIIGVNNMNIVYSSFFTLKIFFDAVCTSYFILEKLIKETEPEEVILFNARLKGSSIIERQDGVVSALLEDLFSKKNSKIKIAENTYTAYNNVFIPELKPVLSNIRTLISLKRPKTRYKDAAIAVHNTHDVPYVAREVLPDTNFYKFYFNRNFIICSSMHPLYFKIRLINGADRTYSALIRQAMQEAAEDSDYRRLSIIDEGVFNFINKHLEAYFLEILPGLLSNFSTIKKWLAKLNPKMALTSSYRVDLKNAFLLEIAKSLKIPVVTYQEGGCIGYLKWPMQDIDADLSDYLLVYGEGVKKNLPQAEKTKILSVGSLRLENARKSLRKKTPASPVIFVVLGIWSMNIWQHYPSNIGFCSQSFLHQLKILGILRQFKNVEFAIKTIKGREPYYEDLMDNECMRIVTEPLIDVLDDASAFILDFPSTTLQECIITDKPIALFYDADCVDFENNALNLLNKRVRISKDTSQFYGIVRSLIDDVAHGTDMTKNDEFLNNYCSLPDTRSRLNDFFGKHLNLKGSLTG